MELCKAVLGARRDLHVVALRMTSPLVRLPLESKKSSLPCRTFEPGTLISQSQVDPESKLTDPYVAEILASECTQSRFFLLEVGFRFFCQSWLAVWRRLQVLPSFF